MNKNVGIATGIGIAVIIGVMIVKQVLYKKKKEPVFQNTEEPEEHGPKKSDEINDIKLDSEYVDETNGSESKDDESVNST